MVIQKLVTMNPYIRKYYQNLSNYIGVAYSCLKYGVLS